MNTTKFLSIITILSCATQIYGMQGPSKPISIRIHQDPGIEVESSREIKSSVKKMVARCEKSPEGFEKCMADYTKQWENYQTRKFTRLCAGQPHDERFSYKEDDKGQLDDISATFDSYNLRGNPGSSVDKCVNESLALFSRRAQYLDREVQVEIRETEAESARLGRRIQVLNVAIAAKDIAAKIGRFFSGD